MDDFDAQLAALDQLFDEGHTDDGLRAAVQMCRHTGPQQEPPNLRDARADLLCKVIMYKIFHGAQADVLSLPESALLDQKIYSWKYGRSAESKLFPGLQTTFDSDDAEALTLAKYIQKVKDRASTKHLKWLHRVDGDVAIEIFSRMQTLSEPLRIGARFVVSGLKKATHLNGKKVTITRKQGSRWGVIFDEHLNAKAVRPINLKVDEAPFGAQRTRGTAPCSRVGDCARDRVAAEGMRNPHERWHRPTSRYPWPHRDGNAWGREANQVWCARYP